MFAPTVVPNLSLATPILVAEVLRGRVVRRIPLTAHGRRRAGSAKGQRTVRAAATMRAVTAPGWEMSETWEAVISTVRARARCAMKRCRSGGMTASRVPMRYQDGIVFHAAAVAVSANPLDADGRWVA